MTYTVVKTSVSDLSRTYTGLHEHQRTYYMWLKRLCAGPVRLVELCLSAGKVWHRRSNGRGDAVKHVQACLSTWERSRTEFSPLLKSSESCWSLSISQERPGMRFSPLWRSYESRASLFMWQERSTKQFSPLWRSCEARASLLKCLKRSRKQFPPLLRSCGARASLFMSMKGPTHPF